MLAIYLIPLLSVQADKPAAPPPVRVEKTQPGVPHHRVTEGVKVDSLHRFPKPVDRPPEHRPPNHRGHSWHWHPHYGWLAFPVAIAPSTVVIGASYRLPATVVAAVEVQPIKCVCPHCGKEILVYP